LFVRQSTGGDRAGVFHNDVVAVANERVLLSPCWSFAERERVLGSCGSDFRSC